MLSHAPCIASPKKGNLTMYASHITKAPVTCATSTRAHRLCAILAAVALSIAFTLAACANTPRAWADDAAKSPIVIIHTNDVHCEVEGSSTAIGYAGIAQAVIDAKSTYGENNVTLVDAGDAIQGNALGALSKGEYPIDIMNQVGYDIAAPGNHEFTLGLTDLMTLLQKANATYVCCNFDDLATHSTVFSPYKIIDYGSTKIAYVGITTPESLTTASPTIFQDDNGNFIYGFCQDDTGQKLYDRVQSSVDNAREAGADYVVAVAHLGQSGITSQWTSSAVAANTSGIDVIIDGHSHEEYEQDVPNKTGKTVKIAQTGTKLATYGQIVINPEQNTITANLVNPPVTQNGTTAAYVEETERKLSDLLKREVATTSVLLKATNRDESGQVIAAATRLQETNLGDLVADTYRTSLDADIGLANGGGIRSDISAGTITYGDVTQVAPFGNRLCKITTSGQSILDALEMGARKYPAPNGGFLQVSGLSYQIRTDIPSSVVTNDEGQFVEVSGLRRVQNVRVGGVRIDPSAQYTVSATSYFVRNGGDGFSMFKDATVLVADGGFDRDAIADYLSTTLGGIVGSPYSNENGEGRIVF